MVAASASLSVSLSLSLSLLARLCSGGPKPRFPLEDVPSPNRAVSKEAKPSAGTRSDMSAPPRFFPCMFSCRARGRCSESPGPSWEGRVDVTS